MVHAAIRKLAHFTEYLILALLVARALRTNGEWRPRHAVLAVLFATAYAMTDEVHQLFVPGRTAAATDVLIDATGALAGQLATAVRRAALR
jgi:VanZ family protein